MKSKYLIDNYLPRKTNRPGETPPERRIVIPAGDRRSPWLERPAVRTETIFILASKTTMNKEINNQAVYKNNRSGKTGAALMNDESNTRRTHRDAPCGLRRNSHIYNSIELWNCQLTKMCCGAGGSRTHIGRMRIPSCCHQPAPWSKRDINKNILT